MSDTPDDLDKARTIARRWSGAVDDTALARLILEQRAEEAERLGMHAGFERAADLRRQAGGEK